MSAAGGLVTSPQPVHRVASFLDGMTLPEVMAIAPLQTRVDRKYLVPEAMLGALLDELDELGDRLLVLDIDDRRWFTYESVYFDTPDRQLYRAAARGRPQRFKVRSRLYVDSGDCLLEVKVRDGRGYTVKHRLPYLAEQRHRLSGRAWGFVAEHIPGCCPTDRLVPTLTTAYRRCTLIDTAGPARITVDEGLVCTGVDGTTIGLDRRLVIETKSAGRPTTVDRLLWAAGHRPVPISKYAVGTAALDPTLPANKWNRILRQQFGWQPLRPTP